DLLLVLDHRVELLFRRVQDSVTLASHPARRRYVGREIHAKLVVFDEEGERRRGLGRLGGVSERDADLALEAIEEREPEATGRRGGRSGRTLSGAGARRRLFLAASTQGDDEHDDDDRRASQREAHRNLISYL